ncbi:MAG: DUF6279 family lipoprotein [Gammaproteobacteria bacterium]|nr:DUF6279 family lipoprotein [Gammaproteobacteria bacterium]
MGVLGRCLVAGLLVAVSGCSVQLAYNNLDRLARWSVGDYIDMTSDQRAYFDAAVEEVWVWHRGEHLPQYADFLDSVAVRFVDGTSEREMQQVVDQVVAWAEEVQARALPATTEMLASLSDAQVRELAVTLEERNREIAEPELGASPAEIRQLWVEEFSERFSRFSGKLTAVQQAYLRSQAERYQPERVLWAEYRRRWQADLLALLRFRQDRAGLERGLAELARHRELYYGPRLTAIDDNNVKLLRESSVWLVNSLTDRQQQRFRDRLGELAEDFRALAARETTAPTAPLPCLAGCDGAS